MFIVILKTMRIHIYIYIYMYTHIHIHLPIGAGVPVARCRGLLRAQALDGPSHLLRHVRQACPYPHPRKTEPANNYGFLF